MNVPEPNAPVFKEFMCELSGFGQSFEHIELSRLDIAGREREKAVKFIWCQLNQVFYLGVSIIKRFGKLTYKNITAINMFFIPLID